jgi:hypothetical protein
VKFLNALKRRFGGFRGFGHALMPIKPYSAYARQYRRIKEG